MNLDELKKKLLQALPPAIRGKLGIELDDDEHDEEEEIDGDEATAEHDVAQMDADGEEVDDEDEDEDEDDEEAQKKAKKTKIIRGVVMAAIAFFIVDEFLNTPDENSVPEVAPIVRPKRPKPVETPVAIKTPVAVETPVEVPTPEATIEVVATPETTPEATPVLEVPPETPAEVLVEQTPEATPEPTPEILEEPEAPTMGQIDPTESETEGEGGSSGLDALMKAVDKSSEMASEEAKKVKVDRNDPTYVAPPNYLRSGRGLVYNCVAGHWACVDKFSYFTCFENQKWNEKNVQPVECITRDVYASVNDCSSIQKYYVNKPEPTDFCGKDSGAQESTPSEPEDLSNLLAP